MLFLVCVMLALFALSVPIAFALGIAALPFFLERNLPLIAIPQVIFDSMDSFVLLAVPLYVLAGRIMMRGGVARRLVDFAVALVGFLKGGLAAATVLTSMLFATISGSSAATAAAIGSTLIPEMERKKYPRPFAAAVVAASGELGVIIPPSVPMVIYAVITGVSITDLFIAGIIPGVMIGLSLILTIIAVSTLRNYGDREPFVIGPYFAGVARATSRAALSLLLPFIILGGIYGGIFTPTEAAVVAVVYALVLGCFIHRELPLRDLPKIFAESAFTSSVVMIIVGFAFVFAYALALMQAPQQIAAGIRAVSDDPMVFLLLVNLFLFVVGMFMETFAAIIILAPVLAPVAIQLGIDPVHFGLIMIVNLAIGMVTPPVGVNLFVACGIAKVSMEQLMRPLVVFLAVLAINMLVITYVPWLSLALIR
ncbi:MAG: TRAP transporter large permease [Burkholderiales bacterium]|jgi:tripartite ATP-independent transporter DctM subunit|nr:TRAP transporter large permease [Burkholderiales bacterium]